METIATAPRPMLGRVGYSTLTALLLGGIVFEVAKHRTGYWQLAAFGIGPDLALLYGASSGLAKGQLHARAVPLYNLLHRYWLPLGVVGLATLASSPAGYLVGGLVWCFHISLDRAVGYGLRTRDGFQRP